MKVDFNQWYQKIDIIIIWCHTFSFLIATHTLGIQVHVLQLSH